MKLVQTLVVRDEADIVGAQIAHHLNAGVEHVIATDHESVDGTTDVLESYARQGVLTRIAECGAMQETVWRTRMARLAHTELGADWVVNTDADEFWLPRGQTLKEVLAAVPERVGVVWALSRHFVPRPDDGRFFAERMIARVSLPAALNDPASPYRPHGKAAHRGHPEAVVVHGAHAAHVPGKLSLARGWAVGEVLHFPFRSQAQWERKGVLRGSGDHGHGIGQYRRALLASRSAAVESAYRDLVVDDEALAAGCASGVLVLDTRLRDSLRECLDTRDRGPGPGPFVPDDRSQDESLTRDAATLLDADLVRLYRHLDGLRPRLAALESRSGAPGALL